MAKQSLYGAADIGDFEVISKRRLTPSGWAIIALSASALALGGCGRKAGLDLPPNAMNAATPAEPDVEADRVAPPGATNPAYSADGGPAASKGRKRPFVLDPLLGN
ncbi:MAG TPA: lipoprotein [Bradyrhizobium sp.]|nr:lipoprotein [Bradyrhizobium sp.]